MSKSDTNDQQIRRVTIVRAALGIDGVALIRKGERAALVIPDGWLCDRQTDAINLMLAELAEPIAEGASG